MQNEAMEKTAPWCEQQTRTNAQRWAVGLSVRASPRPNLAALHAPRYATGANYRRVRRGQVRPAAPRVRHRRAVARRDKRRVRRRATPKARCACSTHATAAKHGAKSPLSRRAAHKVVAVRRSIFRAAKNARPGKMRSSRARGSARASPLAQKTRVAIISVAVGRPRRRGSALRAALLVAARPSRRKTAALRAAASGVSAPLSCSGPLNWSAPVSRRGPLRLSHRAFCAARGEARPSRRRKAKPPRAAPPRNSSAGELRKCGAPKEKGLPVSPRQPHQQFGPRRSSRITPSAIRPAPESLRIRA